MAMIVIIISQNIKTKITWWNEEAAESKGIIFASIALLNFTAYSQVMQ